MTTPRSSAASRRPGDEELARDDRDDHPRREDALVDQHDEHGEDEQLVRDRVEQRPERRRVPAPPRDRPSSQSVVIAAMKTPVAQ